MATYYIDGYNVIHKSSELRPLAMINFEAARDALIESVGRFCTVTGHQAKIVFDGRGRNQQPGKPLAGVPSVEVIYSPGNKTADALIERTVYNSPNRRDIIVVSGDRGIRNLCYSLNSLVMDPDNFLSSIHQSETDTRTTLSLIQKNDPINRMEGRLNESAIDKLNALKAELENRNKK